MPPTTSVGLRKKLEQDSVNKEAAQGKHGATVNSENIRCGSEEKGGINKGKSLAWYPEYVLKIVEKRK